MKKALWWAGYVWALPMTVLGLVLGLLTFSLRPNELFQGCLFIRSSRLLDAIWFRDRFIAFTWGGVCIVAGGVDLTLMQKLHEVVHFDQARIYGLFLPAAYADGAVSAVAQGQHWYRDNFLEIWARRIAAIRLQEATFTP